MGKFPCSICNKQVLSNAIFCDSCELWVHLRCSSLGYTEFQILSKNEKKWFCQNCYKELFPFHNLDNEEFLTVFQNVTTSFSELYKNCKQLNNIAFYENHLIEEEIDINSMTGLTIKSEYLTEEEFRLNFGKIDTAKIIKKKV